MVPVFRRSVNRGTDIIEHIINVPFSLCKRVNQTAIQTIRYCISENPVYLHQHIIHASLNFYGRASVTVIDLFALLAKVKWSFSLSFRRCSFSSFEESQGIRTTLSREPSIEATLLTPASRERGSPL